MRSKSEFKLSVFGSYPHHVDSAYKWYQSGEYSNFFRCVPDFAGRQHFTDLPNIIQAQILMIDAPDGKTSIGMVTIYDHDRIAHNCKCGIMVDKARQRGSVASLACIEVCSQLFETMNKRKVGIEFLGSDESVKGFVRKLWRLIDPKASESQPIEACPWFDGKKRQEAYVNGRYEDLYSFALLKHEFKKLTEIYYGRKNG